METQLRDELPPNAPANATFRAATLALDRAIRTAALYEGRGELCAAALRSALDALHRARGHQEQLRIDILPSGLAVEGDADPQAETRGAAFQLFRDGLRTLWVNAAFTYEALEGLVRILADPFQRWGTQQEEDNDRLITDRDEDTVTRLWEADLVGVQFHAVEAYSEREVELGGARLSVQDWIGRVVDDMKRVARQPVPSNIDHETVPFAGYSALPRTHRESHREGEDRDRDFFAVYRIVFLCKRADIDEDERRDLLLFHCLGCIESVRWEVLDLALQVVDSAAPPATAKWLYSQLRGDDITDALLRAVRKMRPEDAPALVCVFVRLDLDAGAKLAGVFHEREQFPHLMALEAALDARKLHAAMLYQPLLQLDVDVAVWAVGRLGERHRRTHSDADAAEYLRGVLNHRHPGVRLVAFRALDGDTHPDTQSALFHTLASNDKDLLKHCIPQVTQMVKAESLSVMATDALLKYIEQNDFWERPAPVRRLLIGVLGESVAPAAQDWISAFMARRVWFFGRAALLERQDFVRRALSAKGGVA